MACLNCVFYIILNINFLFMMFVTNVIFVIIKTLVTKLEDGIMYINLKSLTLKSLTHLFIALVFCLKRLLLYNITAMNKSVIKKYIYI